MSKTAPCSQELLNYSRSTRETLSRFYATAGSIESMSGLPYAGMSYDLMDAIHDLLGLEVELAEFARDVLGHDELDFEALDAALLLCDRCDRPAFVDCHADCSRQAAGQEVLFSC